MEELQIGDYAQIHLAGACAGSLGDNSIVKIIWVEHVGKQIVYTGKYVESDYGAVSAIKFTNMECTRVSRSNVTC